MSVSYVKIFNQLIDEFFTELIELFPDEPKIKVRYVLFQTIAKANSKKPCMDFISNSIPYLEKIAMRDERLFTSKDKPAIIDAMNIEKIWNSGISENTKNTIWKYIQSFFTIGIKIVEMPPETHEIINYIINQR
jgi:hypothetical protein